MRSKNISVAKATHNVNVRMRKSSRLEASSKLGERPLGGFSAGPLSRTWSCSGVRGVVCAAILWCREDRSSLLSEMKSPQQRRKSPCHVCKHRTFKIALQSERSLAWQDKGKKAGKHARIRASFSSPQEGGDRALNGIIEAHVTFKIEPCVCVWVCGGFN